MLNKKSLDIILDALDDKGAELSKQRPSAEEWEAFEQARNDIHALIDGDAIASIWTVDDVYLKMFEDEENPEWEMERKKRPAEIERARKVLRLIDESHDAEVGINWDVIEHTLIDEMFVK